MLFIYPQEKEFVKDQIAKGLDKQMTKGKDKKEESK
jgi:hypothetical protein